MRHCPPKKNKKISFSELFIGIFETMQSTEIHWTSPISSLHQFKTWSMIKNLIPAYVIKNKNQNKSLDLLTIRLISCSPLSTFDASVFDFCRVCQWPFSHEHMVVGGVVAGFDWCWIVFIVLHLKYKARFMYVNLTLLIKLKFVFQF